MRVPVGSVNQALSHYRKGTLCHSKQLEPVATRSKWVRLPPASLTDQLPVWTTSFCERERCLNYTFVGRSQYKPNCLSGLHRNYDDPKVSNPERSGERERNGISRRWSGACPLSDVDATDKSGHLGANFVGHFETHGDCRLAVHGSIPNASAYNDSGGVAHFGERVTLTNLRRQQNMTDCRLEYIDF